MRPQHKTLITAMLSVALAFSIVIPLGFDLHGRYPSLSDNLLAAIIVATLVVIAAGAMLLLNRLLRVVAPKPKYSGGVQRTGYEMTFHDFCRLISEPDSRPVIAPLLREWYRYEIQGQVIRSDSGHKVDLQALHIGIQSDLPKQYAVYQRAMDLWR